jgi:catechol 2,3-dioxygenase-like lactoylglutathione lyase family enzyme
MAAPGPGPTSPGVRFEGVTPILRVADFERSLAYYADVLGFSLQWRVGDFGCVGRDDAQILLSEGSQGCSRTWLWLNVSDADALYDEVRAGGAHSQSSNELSKGIAGTARVRPGRTRPAPGL